MIFTKVLILLSQKHVSLIFDAIVREQADEPAAYQSQCSRKIVINPFLLILQRFLHLEHCFFQN